MATTSKTEKVFVGNNDESVELTGQALEEFNAMRKEMQDAKALFETKYKAKQKAREDAIKKLAEIAGLTEEEINAIL